MSAKVTVKTILARDTGNYIFGETVARAHRALCTAVPENKVNQNNSVVPCLGEAVPVARSGGENWAQELEISGQLFLKAAEYKTRMAYSKLE